MTTKLLPTLHQLCRNNLKGQVHQLDGLKEIAAFIRQKQKMGETAEIVFVCTHNSRRSQFAQAMAEILGAYFGINIKAYSAGTEATAVYPTVIQTLEDEGFVAEKDGEKTQLTYGRQDESLHLWSKTISDSSLPKSDFLAVMVCSDADEACPIIPGAEKRIALPFRDPGFSDGTPQETKAYLTCMRDIGAHLLWVFDNVDEPKEKKVSNARRPKSKKPLLNRIKGMFRSKKSGSRPQVPGKGSSGGMSMERLDQTPPPSPRIIIKSEEIIPSSIPQSSSPSQSLNPFQKGNILYAVPDQMKLEEKTRCTVRIAPEEIAKEILSEGLDEATAKAAKTEGIKLTQMMKVELLEAEQKGNFEIVNRNDDEQPVFPFGFTEWEFDVTPKRPGHYALLLRVTAKVVIPGFGEKGMNVAVLDRAIRVSTDGSVVTANFEKQSIPDPVWDATDTQAVHSFIAEGRTDKAIARMCNYVFDKNVELHASLLILQGRWNQNTNKLEEKMIRHEDWDIVNNQVRVSVLGILEDLNSQAF